MKVQITAMININENAIQQGIDPEDLELEKSVTEVSKDARDKFILSRCLPHKQLYF